MAKNSDQIETALSNPTLKYTPTPSSIYYIIDASNNVWVRGSISTQKDMAQSYTMPATNNQNINFGSAYIINSATPNTVNSYAAGTAMGNGGDDATPISTGNVGYISADHGLNSPVVTSVGMIKPAQILVVLGLTVFINLFLQESPAAH